MTQQIYLPAEWHNQEFIQLTWPHEKSDWAYMLQEVEECFVNLATEISRREKLLIVAPDIATVQEKLKAVAANVANITYFQCDTNDTWARDHAFITLSNGEEYIYADFQFNGWGKKFPAMLDNAINRKLYDAGVVKGKYMDNTDFVLEGGSIESDGKGTILTTSQCLMAPNRNQPLDKQGVEDELKKRLGAKRVLWLDHGNLIGDDTDGHIDTIARLAPDDTIIYMQSTDEADEQHCDLQAMEQQLQQFRTMDDKPYRLLPLPSPSPIVEDGERLPATYANFLIMNNAILYPTYSQPANDAQAATVLQKAFPGYEIVGVDCRALIKQHGSLHCVTMQYPSNK